MIECIFTIDYEIYGNGQGALRELVYEPARKLKEVFDRHGVKFVNFVEVSEFEQIEKHGTDEASADVRRQIKELHADGYETALHLHPQWTNARFVQGRWELDQSEYNLCVLSRERIAEIVDRGLRYMRDVVEDPNYTPVSFRAGNWLFQPTRTAAEVLASRGLKLDSSVFKGGFQNQPRLDYRRARDNPNFWRFGPDVNIPDAAGAMLELPIHTEMVPFWRMATGKRLGLQKKSLATVSSGSRRLSRLRDYLRWSYPLKFDFCRMTLAEMTSMVDRAAQKDARHPGELHPLVSIGHTKDLVDLEPIDTFLSWLKTRNIPVTTLASAYARCLPLAPLPGKQP